MPEKDAPLKFKPGRRKAKATEPTVRHSTAREDSPELGNQNLDIGKSRNGTKIALPFADTPVIQRNKEMRAGTKTQSRRSSASLRGRRASSLIDSGTSNGRPTRTYGASLKVKKTPNSHNFSSLLSDEDSPSLNLAGSGRPSKCDGLYGDVDSGVDDLDSTFLDHLEANIFPLTAVPHADVGSKDFYKHIDQTLLEPQRMKQLLIWCSSRTMPEKHRNSGKDISGELAMDSARQIQEELLKDFASKPEMSSWFDREDTAPTALVKKPNPRNDLHAAKLKELEAEIDRYATINHDLGGYSC